jgi:hypothetical protein
MTAFTARSAVPVNSLSGLFVNSGTGPGPSEPVVSLAGFDVVAQFSRRILQAQVNRSLSQRSVSTLSAFLPWGSVPLPPSLVALIPMLFRLTLSERQARLELRLVDPYISAMRWPSSLVTGTGGVEAPDATVVSLKRFVDIGWRVEINVLTAKPPDTVAPSVPSNAPAPSSGVRPSPVITSGLLASSTGSSSGSSDSSWDRVTLVTGTAVTSATAHLSVLSNLWRFGMDLDFSDTAASITPDAPAMADFLATDAGKNLLGQALAPLRAATGVELCPQVAPGGALSASYVQRLNLPAFQVQDLLLADTSGNSVLCFCAQLATTTGGVARLVQSYLQGEDFAYVVSTSVLSPALKARWNAAASGLSIVSYVPIQAPNNSSSSQTAPSHAQIQVSFSNILDDVSILAATDNRGDPVRLLSKQSIQLLHLWDPNGNELKDLGSLAEPQVLPLAIPMCLFSSTGAPPESIQPNFRDLLLKLMATVFFPMLDSYSVSSTSISGFASSATKTLFIRWALNSAFGSIFTPVSGKGESVQ